MTGVEIVNIALNEKGVHETPLGSNITKYNLWYYGTNQAAQWCCIFVSWVLNSAGCLHLVGGKHSACKNLEAWCLKNNVQRVDIKNAEAGDIVLFDFDNVGEAHHIGFVVKRLSDGTLSTIEGNTSDQVAVRVRSKSIRYIFRPAYNKIDKNCGIDFARKTLSRGSRNNTVRLLQLCLSDQLYKIEIDGVFGTETDIAVREYQTLKNLEIDGIVGPNTWNAILGVYI